MARNNSAENSSIIIFTPTRVMTFNIYESTIYLTLSILINSTNFNIDGKCLKYLQKRLNDVNYVIIDKKSMVECCMLTLIDMQLRIAFSEYQNQPFGSWSVILVSDFGQLPPVLDEPIYAKNLKRNSLSNDSMKIYNQFQEVYQLNVV